MKKILVYASIALLAACNSNKTEKQEPVKNEPPPMAAIKSPYPVTYSSQFVMDEPQNAESLLNLWKVWDGGDLSKGKDFFADTVELHFADGSMMKASRDSVTNAAQRYRSSLGTSTSTVDAVMAVKSTDKNERWACIWGMEKDVAKGKVDSFYLQETWRFNKDGKADLMFQYRQAGAPPKMMKK